MAALVAALATASISAPFFAVPHGGGACTTAWDCSLGGVCNASRVCECDPWFTGHNCTLLNLAPAKPVNGLDIDGWSTWGGHPVLSEDDGLWHGFFSLMAAECTLRA